MSESPDRLHALDNLRAIMMWLGIVVHVGGIYMVEASPLPWRDGQRSVLADLVTTAIHAFRMPVFFILAGFFCALLVQRRGPGGMLRNRVMRLGVPFALFWPVLWLASGLLALAFLHRMARGTWGLDRSLVPPALPTGPNTLHLWFLWQLLGLCLLVRLALHLPARWWAAAGTFVHGIAANPWGIVLLALPAVWAGHGHPDGILVQGGSFLPPWNEWVHNGVYFGFGLMLHRHQDDLFQRYRQAWPALACAGLVAYLLTGTARLVAGPDWVITFCYASASWLWSFAAIGLALQVLPRPNRRLAYLADSAYWVYLIHFPLTIAFGALLFALPLLAVVKMALNIVATTVVCLVSYRYLVRHTWVSQLLNGKRHPRVSSSAAPAALAG